MGFIHPMKWWRGLTCAMCSAESATVHGVKNHATYFSKPCCQPKNSFISAMSAARFKITASACLQCWSASFWNIASRTTAWQAMKI
ncbi:Uncharacterised protein [Vibrio cholerae]|nr:Uncharacterised protein [Vibrio cholerae]